MVFSPFEQKMVVDASILAQERPDRFRNQALVGYVFGGDGIGWLRISYEKT
jgi:hypothetical protein